MLSIWKKLASLFGPEEKKKGGWPHWTPLGGYPIYGHDSYGRKTPNPTELVQAFEDTVYACASLISDTVASTPVRLYVKTGQGQARPKCQTRPVSKKALANIIKAKSLGRGYTVEEVCEHPALDLLNQCNSYHNRIDLFGLTQLFLETTGNAFWLMKFDGYGIPVGLFLLPTQYIQPVRDSAGMVTAWRFGQGTNEVTYPTEDVIHFKFPSLDDPYGMGHAPLQAAWNRVQLQFKEMGFLDANLSNFGRPDAILAPDEPISPTEAERLAKDFLHRFKGQGAGGVFVADGPMKVTPISWPAKDFAELQLYQTIKNSVSNVFHIPPDIWELGEANRATAEAILYALAVHCIKPRMARLVEKLNERLIPFYDDRLFFEAEAIVPEDKTFELQEMQALLSAGVLTRNEVRIQYGYEPREWANEPLLPPGMMPALAPDEDPAPVEVSPEPVDRSGQAPGLAQLQQAVYAGQLPRQAAVANVQLTFGFSPEQAEALFPDVAPVRLTPPDEQEGPKEAPGQAEDGQADPGQPEAPEGQQTGQKALTPAAVLDLPDIRQEGNYDCGAAATAAVCRFFGVGPETEAEYIPALGTTEADGTSPEAIVDYLGTVGLTAEARNDLEIKDLASFVAEGCPVIVCIQDYEDQPQDIPEEASGHYVVVCAADDDKVTLQDPSAGRVEMPTLDFLGRWEDTAEADYVHYGIAVSRGEKAQGPAKIKALRKKSPLPMASALQRFFKKQKAELLGKVKAFEAKAFPPDNWFDIDQWTREMAEAMRPIVALYYDHAARQTAARIGGSLDLLKVSQPKLQEGIDRATFLFCKETNETTSQELGAAIKGLRESLATGLEAGEVQNELTKRVQMIFDQAEVGRAYRIAVTEASRGQHAAQEIVAQESGLVKGKRWILSDDACDLCKPLAGKVVDLGQSFTTLPTGGPYAEIQHPPLHPACRCDMIEVVEGVND